MVAARGIHAVLLKPYASSHLLRLFEEFSDINQAITSEKEIKSMTRLRKIRSIESMHSQWRDLRQAIESGGTRVRDSLRRSLFSTHLADSLARLCTLRLL